MSTKKGKGKSSKTKPVGGTDALPFCQYVTAFNKGLILVNPNAGVSLRLTRKSVSSGGQNGG
jgi:hypothetical protein